MEARWKPETATPPPPGVGDVGVLSARCEPERLRRLVLCEGNTEGTSEFSRHPRSAHVPATRVGDLPDVAHACAMASRCPSRKATSSTLSPASSAREATVCRNECIEGTEPAGAGTGLPLALTWWSAVKVGSPLGAVARACVRSGAPWRHCAVRAAGRSGWRTRTPPGVGRGQPACGARECAPAPSGSGPCERSRRSW